MFRAVRTSFIRSMLSICRPCGEQSSPPAMANIRHRLALTARHNRKPRMKNRDEVNYTAHWSPARLHVKKFKLITKKSETWHCFSRVHNLNNNKKFIATKDEFVEDLRGQVHTETLKLHEDERNNDVLKETLKSLEFNNATLCQKSRSRCLDYRLNEFLLQLIEMR